MAVSALGLTLLAIAGHGIDARVVGQRVSVRGAARPFFIAALASLGFALSLAAPARAQLAAAWKRLTPSPHVWTAGILALAVSVLLVSIRYGSFAAAASDSYAYITQAELFAAGSARRSLPSTTAWPWPDAAATWAPAGYRLALDGSSLVPTYPTGLPLLMAAAHLATPDAKYLVVPFCAAVVIIATFLLGQAVAGPLAGWLAALLMSVSPIFLLQSLVPMSDVPATAAFTLALAWCLRERATSWMLAGLAAGLGLLIRPNLLPIVGVLAAILAARAPASGTKWRPPLIFLMASLPAILLIAAIHTAWYGSPVRLGHGSVSGVFHLRHLSATIGAYPRWLFDTQAAFVFVCLAAPFVVDWRSRKGRLLLALGVYAVMVFGCYAFYATFPDWSYLRFLLPALPAMLVIAVVVTLQLLERVPAYIRPIAGALVFGTVALATWQEAVVRGAFVNWQSLERFVDVPRIVRDRFPSDAVYLTRVYSGSLPYYSGRQTLRWDLVAPDSLDRAIAALREHRRPPLIVIEGTEEYDWFRDLFAGHSALGALDWPPALEYVGIETVRVYDPADRERSARGESVVTRRIVRSETARGFWRVP